MTAADIARLDVTQAELERQIVELRTHAEQHLAARHETPSAELLAQWHDFLDIDPDLRGRDYTKQTKKQAKGATS